MKWEINHQSLTKINTRKMSIGNQRVKEFLINFWKFSDKKCRKKDFFSRRNKRRKSFAVIFSSLNVFKKKRFLLFLLASPFWSFIEHTDEIFSLVNFAQFCWLFLTLRIFFLRQSQNRLSQKSHYDVVV